VSTNPLADYNRTMRIPAKRAAKLPPDMVRDCGDGFVEVSVRDFFLACDPSPDELAEVDRKRKELGMTPLFGDDV